MKNLRNIAIVTGLCIELLLLMMSMFRVDSYGHTGYNRIYMVISLLAILFNIGLAVLSLILRKKVWLQDRLSEAESMGKLAEHKRLAADRLSMDTAFLKRQLELELKRVKSAADLEFKDKYEISDTAEWDRRLCFNTLCDTVLKLKSDECGRKGIRIDIDADIPSELRLTDIELCSLVCNLLDNAIEASGNISDPCINFRAYINKVYLIISVTNAASAEYVRQQKRSGRGMGLYIVKSIAEKYNGEATMEFDGESFKACVIVEAL